MRCRSALDGRINPREMRRLTDFSDTPNMPAVSQTPYATRGISEWPAVPVAVTQSSADRIASSSISLAFPSCLSIFMIQRVSITHSSAVPANWPVDRQSIRSYIRLDQVNCYREHKQGGGSKSKMPIGRKPTKTRCVSVPPDLMPATEEPAGRLIANGTRSEKKRTPKRSLCAALCAAKV